MPSILLASQHPARRTALQAVLDGAGHAVHPAADMGLALRFVARHRIDLAILEADFGGATSVLAALRRSQAEPRPRIVRLLDEAAARPCAFRVDAAVAVDTDGVALLALVRRLAPGPLPPLPA